MYKVRREPPIGRPADPPLESIGVVALLEERYFGVAAVDVSDVALRLNPAPIEAALGVRALPETGVVLAGDVSVAGVAPGKCLLLGSDEEVLNRCKEIETHLSAAGTPCVVAPISDARFTLAVRGEEAQQFISTFVAIDLRLSRFPPGRCARTRFVDCGCFIQRIEETAFRMIFPQVYAHYVWRLMTDANGRAGG